MSNGPSIVGVLSIAVGGVIIVAAIYQLGTAGGGVVPNDATTLGSNTLTALFK